MNKTNLTGPLTISMTNDYLFRALLQQNNKVLKGLISSLMHLGRSFDGLNRGDNYLEAKPVIQIGLLDFTLFPEYPEFYATYQLLNVKNFIKYSDKLRLHVIDLTHRDLATEEDKRYQIDCWAAFFKATTWEELRMLAKQNEAIAEAVETVYKLSEEEKIRLQCEAREDYYRRQRDAEILRERHERKMQETQQQLQESERRIQELTEQNKQLMAELENKSKN